MKEPVHIDWLTEVDSTNAEVRRRLPELDDLSVIASLEQTAGRGQRGNTWDSSPGENLTFSLVLKPSDGGFPRANRQFSISRAVALGICDHLESRGINCRIKWPNDIYVKDRKVCGVLIENSLSGNEIVSSVIGIGLNVNQKDFPEHLPNPTSMSLCTGEEYSLEAELDGLLSRLLERLGSLANDGVPLAGEYAEKLYRLNVSSEFEDCLAGGRFHGIIRGADETGFLLVETAGGTLKKFGFKEISYVI